MWTLSWVRGRKPNHPACHLPDGRRVSGPGGALIRPPCVKGARNFAVTPPTTADCAGRHACITTGSRAPGGPVQRAASRNDGAVPRDAGAFGDVRAKLDGRRRGGNVAAVCAGRTAGIPRLWNPTKRVRASVLRQMPDATPCGVFVQGAGFLSQLRGPPHGRRCRESGGSCAA